METEERIIRPETILKNMTNKQLKNISVPQKLQFTDLKRISKQVSGSIFDPKICSLWTGYITNINNSKKGIYINFYFNSQKVALHRLLYINFIGELNDHEYIKFSCGNKGRCCNINHLKKYKYNYDKSNDSLLHSHVNNNINKNIDNTSFIIDFNK